MQKESLKGFSDEKRQQTGLCGGRDAPWYCPLRSHTAGETQPLCWGLQGAKGSLVSRRLEARGGKLGAVFSALRHGTAWDLSGMKTSSLRAVPEQCDTTAVSTSQGEGELHWRNWSPF